MSDTIPFNESAVGHFGHAVTLAAEAAVHAGAAAGALMMAVEMAGVGAGSHLAGTGFGSLGITSASTSHHSLGDAMHQGASDALHGAGQQAQAALDSLVGSPSSRSSSTPGSDSAPNPTPP